MNASAAVRGLFGMPRAGPTFRRGEVGEDVEPPFGWKDRGESVQSILRQHGHTITQLSAATRRHYGSRSPYFIPASFLYQLRRGVTPHVCQIVALSETTGYRFVDWLRMFGFDLQQIPRLQMRLHSLRTTLVTPLEDGFEPILPRPSLVLAAGGGSSAPGFGPGEWRARRRYLFAKIGSSDAVVCPGLLPGSIVRIDRYHAHRVRGLDRVSMSHLLWLVELPGGLVCSQLRWIDDRQIVLLPSRPPWGSWPLHLPTEARILGLADMDTRPLHPARLQSRGDPMNLEQLFPARTEERMRFPDLLRISRGRTGLTFRAAHRLTCVIASILRDPGYGIALGMLSDYEAMGRLPRHIAKILSLCMIYCIDIRELMEGAGVRIDDSAKLPLPIFDHHLQGRSDFPDHPAHSGTRAIVTGYARSASART
jgi:hypothetical protein